MNAPEKPEEEEENNKNNGSLETFQGLFQNTLNNLLFYTVRPGVMKDVGHASALH